MGLTAIMRATEPKTTNCPSRLLFVCLFLRLFVCLFVPPFFLPSFVCRQCRFVCLLLKTRNLSMSLNKLSRSTSFEATGRRAGNQRHQMPIHLPTCPSVCHLLVFVVVPNFLSLSSV